VSRRRGPSREKITHAAGFLEEMAARRRMPQAGREPAQDETRRRLMTLERFARLIRVARTKTEYDAACNEYRHEHGEKRLQAALETIDEIFNAEIAEHNARLCRGWPED
jgi:hypothetical protein